MLGLGGLFKIIGTQDAAEGGSPIGEIDVDFRTMKIGQKQNIRDVAANYTVDKEDSGWLLCITAAVTITLPTPDSTWEGVYVDIFNAADNSVTISTNTTDTLITFNDIAADSVAWSTSSEKIGAAGRFIAHNVGGTYKWLHLHFTEETLTETVST